MAKQRLQDLPAGHDGSGFLTVNGQILPAFRIAKVSGKVEAVKESRRFLGEVMTQNAVRGLNGSGDLSYFHRTSALLKAVEAYKDGGVYPVLTLQYYTESPTYGRCEVLVTGIILDTVGLGALDDSSDNAQVVDTAFTFDDFSVISQFKEGTT